MQTAAAPARRVSIDVFRGLTIAAMVIVNNPGDWGQVYAPLLHADWNGWTPTDLIFPFFVFILGVSITLSRRPQTVTTIVKRAAILYAFGFFLAIYPRFNFSIVRIMGVLARLALCSLCAGLIYKWIARLDEEVRLQAVVFLSAVILLVYWALMMFVPFPGGTAGDLTPSGNLGAWVDRTVIGVNHLWRTSKTWDPEGLLSTLPAVATALTGIAAGLVLNGKRSDIEKVAVLICAGGASMAAGLVWDHRFPINKNLWTSSYVLLTSGLASILLGCCFWFFDVTARRRFLQPLIVMGRNPLALFVLSGFLVKTLTWDRLAVHDAAGKATSLYDWIYQHGFVPLGLGGPKNTSLAFALAMLAFLYLPLLYLHKKHLFLRA
jgi:predicted acyltransferase